MSTKGGKEGNGRPSWPYRIAFAAMVGIWSLAPTPSGAQTTNDLYPERKYEPVAVSAGQAQIDGFYNTPVSNLAALRYSASTGVWTRIPFQVDQRTIKDLGPLLRCGAPLFLQCACAQPNTCHVCELSYVWDNPAENDPDDTTVPNSLDSNDEIVFMAKDAGDQAPAGAWPPGTYATARRYEIKVFTPTDGAGWVYLYKLSDLQSPPSAPTPYVDFTIGYVDPQNPCPPDWPGCPTELSTFRGCYHLDLAGFDIYQAVLKGNWSVKDLKIKAAATSAQCNVSFDGSLDVLDRAKWHLEYGPNDETHDTWDGSSNRMGYRIGPVRAIRGSVGAASGPATTHYFSAYPTWWREDVHVRVHALTTFVDGYIDWMSASANLGGQGCVVTNFSLWRRDLAQAFDYVDGGCPTTPIVEGNSFEARQYNGPYISLAEITFEDPQHAVPATSKLMYREDNKDKSLEPGREDEAGAYGNIGFEFQGISPTAELSCSQVNFAGITRIWQAKVSDSENDRAKVLDDDVVNDPLRVTSFYQCLDPNCGVPPSPPSPCPPTINATNPQTGYNTDLAISSPCGTTSLWFLVYKAGEAGPFQFFANLGASLTFKDHMVERNQTYRYYAVSYNAAGQASSPSPTATVTVTDTTPPGPPVISGSISGGQVTLTWAWTTERDLQGYNVYRSLVSGGPYTKINLGGPIQATSYTSIVLGSGVTYYFVVKTVDRGGLESVASNEVALTVQ